MPLSDTAIRSLKPADKPHRAYDERGLYLEVSPSGGKLWRMKYRFGGKEKRLALGSYPDVSLKSARERRDAARTLLAEGRDPGLHKKAEKMTRGIADANTFQFIADEWYKKHKHQWAESHSSRMLAMFKDRIYPYIGSFPITAISAPEVLSVLRRIEKTSRDMAHRALSDIGRVFRYAIATGRAQNDPTAALRGALPPKKNGHFAATLDPVKLGAILRMFDEYAGAPSVRCALRLAPHVFVRPGELRKAKWADIDLKKKEWAYTIGKTDTPHIVPLSRQAVAIFEEMKPLTGNGIHVFVSTRAGRPLSDMALLVAMRSMGISQSEMTTHGFRAVARTLLDEVLKVRPDLIEHQLGHAVRDANGRAYNRTTFIDDRRKMMQAWSNHLDGLKKNTRPSRR